MAQGGEVARDRSLRHTIPASLWSRSHLSNEDVRSLDHDRTSDLLIVGGGFTGCAAALAAAQTGATVTLIEAERIGHGGSGRNVGLVNAGLWMPAETICRKLGREAGERLVAALSDAPELVFGLIDQWNIDCSASRRGSLHLAHSRAGVRDLEERYRQGTRAGAPLHLLNADETERKTGSRAFFGSLLDPRAGTIQPLAYCRGLARAAGSCGASLFEHSRLDRLQRQGSVWVAQVNGHAVRAENILLATNAYGAHVPGVPTPEFATVHYCQFATPPLPAEMRAHILPDGEGCWDTARIMSSLRLDADGRLIIGGLGRLAGAGARIHARWASRKLASIYPHLAGTSFDHGWDGAIAMTSDHLPKVVAFGPNALSIYGYSGRGIGPGTVFGTQAAARLLRDDHAMPLAAITAHRERMKAARTLGCELAARLVHLMHPMALRLRTEQCRA